MRKFIETLRRFQKDERGVTAIEYGLIAALVGVALVAGARTLGTQLGATFNTVAGTLSSA